MRLDCNAFPVPIVLACLVYLGLQRGANSRIIIINQHNRIGFVPSADVHTTSSIHNIKRRRHIVSKISDRQCLHTIPCIAEAKITLNFHNRNSFNEKTSHTHHA